MNYANDPKFSSIVGLTQFRDLRSLRAGLVATIIGKIGIKHPTRLYERETNISSWNVVEFYDIAVQEKLIPNRSHTNKEDLFSGLQRKADLATLSVIKNPEIHFLESTLDGRPRHLFPIYSGKQLLSSLIVEGSLSLDDQIFIDTLLQVYTNLFTLLKNSINDCLTGLYNRQAFDRNIRKMDDSFTRKRRRRENGDEHACCAFFDIDHFKSVNDNFGHLYGDEVLVLISNLMKESFRETDEKYRYGGEEFVVILKGTTLNLAKNILEKFREKVESYLFPKVGEVTVSIGLTYVNKKVPMITIIERADKAVYYSKENGRNQVTVWEEVFDTKDLAVGDSVNSDICLL